MTVLFEPASAIAAGICLTARTIAAGRGARHPRPCGWCDWPLEDLRRMVDGFNAWAECDERGRYHRFEASVFQGLPHREQVEQVVAAQAFPPLEEPTAAVEPAPAHDQDDDEGGPIWMRSE